MSDATATAAQTGGEATPTPAPPAAPAEGTPTPPAEGTPAPPAEGEPTPGTTALTGAEPEGTPAAPGEGETPPGAPETYELNVPEGAIPAELMTAAETRLKEAGLTNDQAQTVMDLELERQKQTAEAINRQEREWIDQVKSDTEMGGANFPATLAAGREVMAWFNDPELAAFLDSSRGGSHPAIIRAFLKVHREIGEGTLSAGASTTAPADKTPEQLMYGTVDVAEGQQQPG